MLSRAASKCVPLRNINIIQKVMNTLERKNDAWHLRPLVLVRYHDIITGFHDMQIIMMMIMMMTLMNYLLAIIFF